MNTSKIIKGVVGGGRYTVTAPIIKEDYGLYLKIEGLELPETYQVDFSNSEHNGTSVTMIGNSDGVLIPSQFISSGKDIFAFLYHVGADYGRTVFKFRIPNKCRPDRTDEQPTPEQQSVIDQAINALNSAVEQTAQDVIDADASAQSASQSADRAEEAKTDAQNYATQAEQSATDAQTSASQASASATASAQSAGQARQSEQNARASAEEAHGYASASAQSATASANSASQASGYAQSANSFANEAHSFAVSAQTSAQTASTKASEASASADLASRKASEITGLTAQANTLPAGSSATANYSNGTLTLGIPQGADGNDYVLTEQDKQDIADLVDAGGMVVNATLVSGTQYTIDSTYDAIKTALSAGKTVVVMTGGVPQPYVGNVQLYDEWYLAFGVSTIYDNIATLTGFMIPQTYQNVAIWTAQNTTIPTLNDVQIDGTSIVTNGVANVPIAGVQTLGAVRVNGDYGIGISSGGRIGVATPTEDIVKDGTNQYKPITPKFQHSATFYGLAKSAGDTTQSASSNAVGTYTEDAKAAIQKMLGIYQAPWELIREDTFTNEEQKAHIINKDANGESFELTDVMLMFETPKQSVESKWTGVVAIHIITGNGTARTPRYECGGYTQAANSVAHIGSVRMRQDGNSVEIYRASVQTPSNTGTLGYRVADGLIGLYDTVTDRIFFSLTQGIVYVDDIKIENVLGTGHYKLYGRRKWQ